MLYYRQSASECKDDVVARGTCLKYNFLGTGMSLIDVFNCNGLGGYIEDYRCKKHLSDRPPWDAMASNCTSVALLLLLSLTFYVILRTIRRLVRLNLYQFYAFYGGT